MTGDKEFIKFKSRLKHTYHMDADSDSQMIGYVSGSKKEHFIFLKILNHSEIIEKNESITHLYFGKWLNSDKHRLV